LDRVDAASLRGWTPVWVRASGAEPVVDWALVEGPFTESFFVQTADRAMRHPFNQVFARRTPLRDIERFREVSPGIAPTGFVFHMSRCGSTLIAQMLAQLSSTIVLSEAQPLDALLRLRGQGVDDVTLIGWLRGMVSALGQPRARERRLFVKFHAWHVLELPFLARAFPEVPWVFVFREPRDVLRSQFRIPGSELDPAATSPSYLGLDFADAVALGPERFGTRVIAAFCAAALRHAGTGRSAFVDYAALPEIAVSRLLDFFSVQPCSPEIERMRHAAGRDTKSKGAFRLRAAEPNGSGTAIDRLCAKLLDGPCAALRAAAL
jgi:hypothetical protein